MFNNFEKLKRRKIFVKTLNHKIENLKRNMISTIYDYDIPDYIKIGLLESCLLEYKKLVDEKYKEVND